MRTCWYFVKELSKVFNRHNVDNLGIEFDDWDSDESLSAEKLLKIEKETAEVLTIFLVIF